MAVRPSSLRAVPLPPDPLRGYVGDGDFEAIGEEFVGHLVERAGLQPDHAVLDVGCGIGRMARPLTGYLTTGTYHGFDVVPEAIGWCRTEISSRYPNFRFVAIDCANEAYNQLGGVAADTLVFPYPDQSFDVILLASVFTHLRPPDVANYLRQIHRVLRTGGRCLFTAFLLNAESERGLQLGTSFLPFATAQRDHRLHVVGDSVVAVAYPESLMRRMIADAGLAVRDPVPYGTWSGRPGTASVHDLVVVVRP